MPKPKKISARLRRARAGTSCLHSGSLATLPHPYKASLRSPTPQHKRHHYVVTPQNTAPRQRLGHTTHEPKARRIPARSARNTPTPKDCIGSSIIPPHDCHSTGSFFLWPPHSLVEPWQNPTRCTPKTITTPRHTLTNHTSTRGLPHHPPQGYIY
jgi:hypothetical protein